jgi:hypothetical protein
MRMEIVRPALFVCVLALGFTTAVSGYAAQNTQANQNASYISKQQGGFRLAAGGNPAVCKANYDNCVGGCGGMSGCISQCAANYRGCLGQ